MPTRTVDIKEIQGLVTNIDTAKAPGNIATDMRGLRNFSAGKVVQRDFGTRNVLSEASLNQVRTTPTPDQTIKGGFYLYNPDTQLDHLILMAVDASSPDATHFWLETTGGANGAGTFIELTQSYSYTIDSFNSKQVIFTAILSTDNDSLNGWIAVNTSRAGGALSVQFIEDSVKTDGGAPAKGNITVGGTVGTQSTDPWQAGDTVAIFRSLAFTTSTKAYASGLFTASNGTAAQEQHLASIVTESIPKAMVAYGNVAENDFNVIVPNRPFYIKYESAARGLLYANDVALITRPIGWWGDQGGDPAPVLHKLSTLSSPLSTANLYTSPATATMILYGVDKTNGWGKIIWSYGGYDTGLEPKNAGFQYDFHRIVVTLTLDGYGETDPVGEAFFVALQNDGAPHWTVVIPDFYINPGMMPRNLTAINVYHSRAYTTLTGTVANPGDAVKAWANDNGRLRLNNTIYLTEQNHSPKTAAHVEWAADLTNPYPYKLTYAYATWQDVPEESTVAIDAALGRAPRIDSEDTALTPRFLVRTSRQQGAIIVADESDDTLRLSVIDGYGVSADMIFPEVPYDINNRVQRIELTGRSQILGLGVNNDSVMIVKRTEMETVDLQSNLSTLVPIDCVARRSILQTPYGMVWAGDSAIYFRSWGGPSLPKVLNRSWQNRYNGQEVLSDNVTQYITQAYRKTIVAGWDPAYQEVWFDITQNTAAATHEHLCYRYSFLTDNWSIRELNTGDPDNVDFFAQNVSGDMIIGITNQVLMYPNKNFSAFPFEDAVTNDGDGTFTSTSHGIPTWVKFNLGAFDTIADIHSICDFMVDHEAVVTSSSTIFPEATLEFYANRETSAFDTKTFTIADEAVRRKLEPRGSVENLQLKVSLPTTEANLCLIQQFDINLIQIGVIPNGQRTGNA